MKTKRDQGRMDKASAGAEDRAAAALEAIAKMREKGTNVTRQAIAGGKPIKLSDIKDSWPMHSIEGVPPTAELRPAIEGEARIAYCRARAGLPLSARDEYLVSRFPDGGPAQAAWEEACRQHREASEA